MGLDLKYKSSIKPRACKHQTQHELEKHASGFGVELEVEVSVGVLEGERLVVVTPNAGVLTLEVEAVVMAVLEDGVDALETGGDTGVAGGFEGLVALEVGGVEVGVLEPP